MDMNNTQAKHIAVRIWMRDNSKDYIGCDPWDLAEEATQVFELGWEDDCVLPWVQLLAEISLDAVGACNK